MSDPIKSSKVTVGRRTWRSVLRDARQRRIDATREQAGDEAGVSLVEMMITILMLSIVLAITTPAISMFFDVNNDVSQTYLATNQVVLASEVLTQYLHEAIAPCPTTTTSTTCSKTAFATTPIAATAPSSSSLTFYANVNYLYGPAKIVMKTSGTTFTVSEYLPTASSCPFTNSATTASCTYPTNATHLIASVSNLTNVSTILSYDISATTNACSTSTPTASQITAVCITLQTALKGGLAGGYQAMAFALASTYNGSVG